MQRYYLDLQKTRWSKTTLFILRSILTVLRVEDYRLLALTSKINPRLCGSLMCLEMKPGRLSRLTTRALKIVSWLTKREIVNGRNGSLILSSVSTSTSQDCFPGYRTIK